MLEGSMKVPRAAESAKTFMGSGVSGSHERRKKIVLCFTLGCRQELPVRSYSE